MNAGRAVVLVVGVLLMFGSVLIDAAFGATADDIAVTVMFVTGLVVTIRAVDYLV